MPMAAPVNEPQEDTSLEFSAAARRWGIAAAPAGRSADYSWLLGELTERIHHLLRHNPEKLMNSLYVLDVSETRYVEAMSAPALADKAARLAEAVLDRESEKIASRLRYRRSKRDQEALEDGTDPRKQA